MYRYCYCKSMCKWYEIYMHDWWWLMMIDDWLLFLINIDDVCMLYSLWFYSVPWFPLLFRAQIGDPSIEMKVFSAGYLRALFHASGRCAPGITCVADTARPGRPYSWPMIKCRKMASYEVGRGHDPWRNVPKLQWDLLVTAKWDKFMCETRNQNRNNWCGNEIFRFWNLHLFGILKASWARRC